MKNILQLLFAPGFFANNQVKEAILVGGLIAFISGIIGVFVIIRGQVFAGHAISDFGGAGAAISFLLGVNTLWGFLIFSILSSIGVEIAGKHAHERNLATGVVLSFAMGIESLFLFLDTHNTGQSGAAMLILFGSIFIIKSSTIPVIICLTITSLIILICIYRPLVTSSITVELASILGIPVKFINYIFIVLLALVVGQSSLIIGALLSTALLIGPAAIAMSFARSIKYSILFSSIIAVSVTWLGIILAYDSYYWLPSHRNWPVSFFVCALILAGYLIAKMVLIISKKGDRKIV
ncbi:MAG: metal ABC transporter permease [Lactococcus plantarum]|nr:metal ABC transporter permease [Lactococcus plantarum]MDN6084971.1 metal ABC transporter permease [Lactococcus plantarum]